MGWWRQGQELCPAGLPGALPRSRGQGGAQSVPTTLGERGLADPLASNALASGPRDNTFLLFPAPGMWHFVRNSPGKEPYALLPPSPPAPASCSQLRTLPELWVPPPHPTFSETLVLESGPQPSAPSTRPPPPQHVEVLQPHPSPSRLPTPDPPGPGLSPLAPFQDDILRRSRRVWPLPHPVHWRTTGIRLPCPPLLSPQQVLAGVQVAAPPSLPDLAERPARSALPFPAGLLWFPSFARSAGFVRSGSV